MKRGPAILVLLITCALTTTALGALSMSQLANAQFLDDQGMKITAPLETCALTSQGVTCWRSSSVPLTLEARELTIEGPEHGPVTIDLATCDPATLPRIPRKARLRLPDNANADALSLYALPSRVLDRPTRKIERPRTTEWVPAGSWLASVSARDLAPALTLFDAAPGADVSLTPPRAAGWSLVILTSAPDGTPSQGIAELFDAEEPAATAKPLSTALVLHPGSVFSGIGRRVLTARVSVPGFLTDTLGGITSAPGTFAVRHVTLRQGATLNVAITTDGTPAAIARWLLLTPASNTEDPPIVVAEGSADEKGKVHQKLLPPGRYVLRVYPPALPTATDESLTLADHETTDLNLDLTAVTLQGTVTRSSEPLEAYRVSASRIFSGHSPDGGAATSTMTDADGRYVLHFWRDGQYSVGVTNPTGTLMAGRLYWVPSTGARLDFELLANDLSGRVVDHATQPVSNALVVVKDAAGLSRIARTDTNGEFSFQFREPGSASVFADKTGYRRTDPIDVTISEKLASPPLTIILQKYPSVRARLERSSGAPAVGVSVSAVEPSTATVIASAVVDPDGMFEIRSAGASTRLFGSGPDCPLTGWDVTSPGEDAPPLTLRCLPSSAAVGLGLNLRDQDGAPVLGEPVRLRLDGRVVPDQVLAQHQQRFGVTIFSNPSGRVDVVGVQPGTLDIFLARGSSPATLAAGLSNGFVLSLAMAPGEVQERLVTLAPLSGKITP